MSISDITLEYNLFATDDNCEEFPEDKRVNPFKVSVRAGTQTNFYDVFCAALCKYESETGRRMDRNKPVTVT